MRWEALLREELPAVLLLLDVPKELPYIVVDGDEGGLAWRPPLGWVVEIPRRLQDEERLTFYLHCWAHYLLKHQERRPDMLLRDVWDAAADYVANAFLRHLVLSYPSVFTRRAPHLRKAIEKTYPYNPQFKCLSVEDVYFRLIKGGRDRERRRYKDTHENFSSGGGWDEKTPAGSGGGDGRAAGNVAGSAIYECKVAPAVVPPKLEMFVSRNSLSLHEDLDVLGLSYRRVETVWMHRPQVVAVHIVDVSDSVWNYLSRLFSAALTVILYLYEAHSECQQYVVFADGVKQGLWWGWEPDGGLLRRMRRGVGGGGTLLFKSSLEDILRAALNAFIYLFVYSDLFLFSEDIFYLREITRRLGEHRSRRIAITPYEGRNDSILSLFHLHLTLRDFSL